MINIAINTFKEIIRNKYMYMIVFFGFIFIAFSIILGKLTIGEDSKIIVDFGLAMIEIFGLLGVLFVGSQLLFREIDGKTIFLILSKPIKRYEFIIGKIMGFSMTILLITLFQSILFIIVLFIKDINIDYLIIWSLVNIFLKLEIMLVIVFFLSTFMSNMLIIASSLMIYFASHSFSTILDLVNKMGNNIAINGVKLLQLLFPPFEALNTKDIIGNFSDFSNSYFMLNFVYSVGYFFIVLYFTVVIFSRKKFEN
ncbi:MAG: ABC transporter permease subunit [Candidatus Gracilibacteria bacterium]|nr:ABC transporter permease subunit [Candidatus Gracilibacteria bacterium]